MATAIKADANLFILAPIADQRLRANCKTRNLNLTFDWDVRWNAMKTQATFKQTDVKRAIKAVQEAGLDVQTVEIKRDGTIRILISEPTTHQKQPDPEL